MAHGTSGGTVYEVCEVCGVSIKRDHFRAFSGDIVWSEWVGFCGCPNRKWRSLSETGNTGSWELIV